MITTGYDAKAIRAALDQLEALGTPGAIANFFAAEGVTGGTGDPTACPVAKWVAKQISLPPNRRFSMGFTVGRVIERQGPYNWATLGVFRAGEAVAGFVKLFDLRKYPELVASHDAP